MRSILVSDEVFIVEDSYKNQIIEAQEKYEKVWDGLHQLKGIGYSVNDEKKESVKKKVDDLVQNMQRIKEIVNQTARPLLTTKEFRKLEDQEETSSADPSIQFFGLEWTLFLPRWSQVGENLPLYWTNLESGIVDISGVRGLHQLINNTVVDLGLHCMAVITDQLSEDKLREQMLVQQKMTFLGKQRKSCHVSQYLEIADLGGKQMSSRLFKRKSHGQIKIPAENSKDLKLGKKKDEHKDEDRENMFCLFSNIVSNKMGMRRKSSYNASSLRKCLSDRRKSSNDVYRVNSKNMLENISVLATGTCGVGIGMKNIFVDDQSAHDKER